MDRFSFEFLIYNDIEAPLIGLNPQKTKCRNELHIIDFINTTKCKIDLIEIWNL